MKKSFFIYFIVFLLLAVSSCKKETVENSSNYYSSVDGISILNEDVLGYIDHIESDTIIVFSGSIPDDAIPKTNTNIYVPVSDKTPYGMLVKVISVNEGGYVYVTTSPLSLDEAFEYLSIDESFTYTTELEGIYDSLWNPIDFEIIDTADINLNDTMGERFFRNSTAVNGHFDWDWEDECLTFPVTIRKGDHIDVTGAAYVGFRKMDFDIDISNHKLRYLCLDATPYVKVGVSSNFSASASYDISKRLGTLRFKLTIPTPAGIPIIIPITLSVNGIFGVSGEISASLGLQYEYNCNCVVTYRNGQWQSQANHGGFQNKSPWTVRDFNVNGQIHGGLQFGLLAGLYSSTVGIGFHVSPDFSIETEASLASENLLRFNPNVDLNLTIGSDVYCIARIFGLNLGKYTLQFPDYVLWSKSMPLLPTIENFDAYGNGSSADISWSHNKDYFLYLFGHGVKTGATVFESDASTEVNTYKPSPSNSDETTNYYNVNATGLQSGRTYYAAPLAYWGPFHWHGDKVEFTTEGSYHLDFRCVNQSYDVISFDFNLNNTTGNVIDYTTDAADYDGSPMRVHITATYNATNQTLNGSFDFYFYDDPGQERIDGFSVSLATNDSGYVNCYKIVDNGGCDAALRIYLNGSKASMKKYATPISNDNCNIGIFNKNYGK